MRKNNKKTTYEAIGFIEALIAILLVGVSSLLLLQIAIDTINNAIQNEAIDHMTQYAMEGAEMVQDLYNKHKMDLLLNPDLDEDEEGRERYFPTITPESTEEGNCFVINKSGGDVFFATNSSGDFVRFVRGEQREQYRQEALIDIHDYPSGIDPDRRKNIININEQFFRIVCLDGDMSGDEPFLLARIVVGQRYFSEELFGGELYGNFVRDYEYLTVIQL